MSYQNVADKLRTYLLADSTLKAYSHWVDLRFNPQSGNTRVSNCVIEINTPQGRIIEPANQPHSGGQYNKIVGTTTTVVIESEVDIETYIYQVTLRTLRRGYTDRFELVGLGGKKTVFDFLNDTRNAMDKFLREAFSTYGIRLQDLEYSGIDFFRTEGEGHIEIQFNLSIQEEVEIESR
jgi:hypothetical protein